MLKEILPGKKTAVCPRVKCLKGDVLICGAAPQQRERACLLAAHLLSVSVDSADFVPVVGIRGGERGATYRGLRTSCSQPAVRNEKSILQDLEGKPR